MLLVGSAAVADLGGDARVLKSDDTPLCQIRPWCWGLCIVRKGTYCGIWLMVHFLKLIMVKQGKAKQLLLSCSCVLMYGKITNNCYASIPSKLKKGVVVDGDRNQRGRCEQIGHSAPFWWLTGQALFGT
ncbi:hypothetical protein HAX54_030281 [Datura stramonium]|uniref:Uncharacterized protein n=1 Tax=Datura stramonium TaxID=4076 RepID=A0ABS8V7V3_DATST|nr:hypothetical protein [Datura stramonium]